MTNHDEHPVQPSGNSENTKIIIGAVIVLVLIAAYAIFLKSMAPSSRKSPGSIEERNEQLIKGLENIEKGLKNIEDMTPEEKARLIDEANRKAKELTDKYAEESKQAEQDSEESSQESEQQR